VRHPRSDDAISPDIIGSVTLSGRVRQRNCEEMPAATGAAVAVAEPMKRTRGHLPKPATLTQDVVSTSSPAKITFATDLLTDDNSVCSTSKLLRTEALEAGNILSLSTPRHNQSLFIGAIQMENVLSSPFITLDLSSSSSSYFEYGWRAQQAGKNSPIFDRIKKSKKPRTLRSSMEELDLSGLLHLKELSVRGCGSLQSLKLPPSLCSLDAGGCSELVRIDFPNGSNNGSMRSLDLSGCRKLRGREQREFLPRPGLLGVYTTDALRSVVHLDMSRIHHGALDDTFRNALRSTVSLEMFTLRYSANDEVLKALAESESAASGNLRMVDIAFSTKVTDESVELLARSATKLERLNMRGCKKIAVSCYNSVPVYLERRRRREEDGSVLEEGEAFRTCSRKGDNLFYFCQSK